MASKNATEIKKNDVIELFEGPKEVKDVRYLKDNRTLQVTFMDGSKIKVNQFAIVHTQEGNSNA